MKEFMNGRHFSTIINNNLCSIRWIQSSCRDMLLILLMTIWLLFVMYQPLDSINLTRILPIMSTTPSEMMKGVLKAVIQCWVLRLYFYFSFYKGEKTTSIQSISNLVYHTSCFNCNCYFHIIL